MKKIVIDARELRTTSGRYVERLLFNLQNMDKENKYTVLLKPADFEGWQIRNINFEKVVCPYKEFTFSEQIGFLGQLRKLDADLVHFPMVQQPVLYKGTTITTMNDLTTLRYGNPSKNALVYKLKQMVYKRVNKRVAKKSDTIITYTQYVRDDVVKFAGILPDKVDVIPLAADKITLPPEEIVALKYQKFIMYVGRPTPHKNLERLLEAFARLKGPHPELILVLAGKKDANYRMIEEQVRIKGPTNVLFTDFVSDGQLRWLYENCLAYVFPSLSEGFGLPGLEAMVHGAPVISSNATCLPEVYGDAAHYFDPLDVQAITNAINEVLTDSHLRAELIAKGLRQGSLYSWQKTAQQTIDAYNSI